MYYYYKNKIKEKFNLRKKIIKRKEKTLEKEKFKLQKIDFNKKKFSFEDWFSCSQENNDEICIANYTTVIAIDIIWIIHKRDKEMALEYHWLFMRNLAVWQNKEFITDKKRIYQFILTKIIYIKMQIYLKKTKQISSYYDIDDLIDCEITSIFYEKTTLSEKELDLSSTLLYCYFNKKKVAINNIKYIFNKWIEYSELPDRLTTNNYSIIFLFSFYSKEIRKYLPKEYLKYKKIFCKMSTETENFTKRLKKKTKRKWKD